MRSAPSYALSPAAAATLAATPVILLSGCLVALGLPVTRDVTRWVLAENHPVEMLTFVVGVVAGVHGLVLARRTARRGEPWWATGFYVLFSAGMIFTGMEEIAWGQQLFHFATPEAWKMLNAQHETTLHNFGALQGLSEIPRLAFGAGGLVGVFVARFAALRAVAVPRPLAPWFIIITLQAAVDLANDFVPVAGPLDPDVARASELVELLIAMAAWLYVAMNDSAARAALRGGVPPAVNRAPGHLL